MPTSQDLELVLRIFLAAGLGGIVGLERERRGRPAGLRTFMLVSAGAATFTVVSIYGFQGLPVSGTDPARVAAQVVTGVGFLGAGLILRQAEQVRGLTTAASIWAVAAIGLAAGTGLYWVAVSTTVLVALILYVLRLLEIA